MKNSTNGKRFTQATKVNVRFDHLQEAQMAAKLAAEVQTGTGHDLLRMHLPLLHATNLADIWKITRSGTSTPSTNP